MKKLWRKTLTLSCISLGLMTTGLMTSNSYAANVPEGTTLATKQILTLQIGDNPATLDPSLLSENVGSQIVNNLFMGLTTYDENGKLVPGVAESWTHSPDNKVWTFKLRANAKWSDGSPLTAHDFVASWQRLVNPKTASEYSFYLQDLGVQNATAIVEGKAPATTLGVKALDDQTFEVTLDSPVPWFLEATPLANLSPLPSKLLATGAWPNFDNLVSNGPYTLAAAIPNEKYVIKKNPYFFDADKTVVTDVTFSVVRSSNDAYKRFQAGDLDAFSVDTPALKRQFLELKDPSFAVLKSPAASFGFYQFYMAKAPFDDIRARKAVVLAVNTQEMQQKVYHNTVVSSSVWASPAITGVSEIKESPYFNQPFEQRVAEAKRLLIEAGYSESNPLTFTLNYNTSDGNKLVAIALQAQLKQNLGKLVNVSLHNVEWSTFLTERQTGAYTFFRMGWGADYYEPSTFYSIWTSTNPTNAGKFKSDLYDSLFKSLYTTQSNEERLAIYQKLNDEINNQAAGLPLFSSLQMTATIKNLHGYLVDDNTRRVYNMYISANAK